MSRNGHDFLISAKDKDVTLSLLDHYGIEYYNRGKAADTIIGKAFNIICNDIKLLGRVRRFAPDLMISFSSPIAAHLSFLLRKPCIAIEDTECAGVVHRSYIPFSAVVLTPSCFSKKLGRKQIPFNGYKELAYLHPNYFTPNLKGHDTLGINSNERYIVVRFVSRNAMHDKGEQGLTEEFKVKLVERLSKHIRVFVISEKGLPQQLEPYRISTPSWEVHNVLAGAELLMGESATMAAEAAVLGVPAIFIDSQSRGYTNELEQRYGLVYHFDQSPASLNRALDKAIELVRMPNGRAFFQQQRIKMLSEKIDVTAFLVWFVENYPESVRRMREEREELRDGQ